MLSEEVHRGVDLSEIQFRERLMDEAVALKTVAKRRKLDVLLQIDPNVICLPAIVIHRRTPYPYRAELSQLRTPDGVIVK